MKPKAEADLHLPELNQNHNFKKSFFARFYKDKKERINSQLRKDRFSDNLMYQRAAAAHAIPTLSNDKPSNSLIHPLKQDDVTPTKP